MSTPNEPKPLGAEEIDALLAAATGSDLANEAVVGALVRAIRTLTAELATANAQNAELRALLEELARLPTPYYHAAQMRDMQDDVRALDCKEYLIKVGHLLYDVRKAALAQAGGKVGV